MDAEDQARLEAYARSQNFFRGVAREAAEKMLEAFIRRTMPWLIDILFDAIETAWVVIRRKLGW